MIRLALAAVIGIPALTIAAATTLCLILQK